MKRLQKIFAYLPLGVAFVGTFLAEGLLGNISVFSQLILSLLWGLLLLGWLGRWALNTWKKRAAANLPLALPLTVFVLALTYWSHLSVYSVWWVNRSEFERGLRLPAMARSESKGQLRIGHHRVLQISKQGDSTRFVTSEEGLFSGSISGYAYCPRRCEAVKFSSYWLNGEGKAAYIPLGRDWYAWIQSGNDLFD